MAGPYKPCTNRTVHILFEKGGIGIYVLEMGQSSVDAEVWPRPNVRLGSARQHVTIWPNFGKHTASFLASHLRRFVLSAGVN